MADEITETRSVSVVNGNFKDYVQSEQIKYTMNAAEKNEGTVASSTTEADLAFTGVTTPTLLILKNLDDTDIIQWGPKSAGVMVEVGRIGPKGEAKLQLGSGVTIRYRSVAGTPRLRWRVWG